MHVRHDNEGNILIDGSDSDFTLDQSFSLGIRNPFRIGLNQTANAGYLEFGIPSAANNASGEIYFGGSAVVSISFDDLIYMNTSGNWAPVVNSSSNSTKLLGIALGSNPTTNGVLLKGYVRDTNYAFQEGEPLYISSSNGAITSNPNAIGSGDYARVVGYGLPNNTIYFNPDNTWVQLV